MANPEHIKIVKRGAEAIRAWREKNRDVPLDLNQANLTGIDLSNSDLSGSYSRPTDLRQADLSSANLTSADLRGVDLDRAKLVRAILTQAHLSWAVIVKADLAGADLSGANLGMTILTEANLTGTNLAETRLYATNLSGANLAQADLSWANLMGTGLYNARLNEARLNRTVFANVDLQDTKGLDKIKHLGPSSISIDTLFRSKGNIPKVFLQGCGVPEHLIELLPSLMGMATDFYTCFISFTEADDAFSERLYNDLQGAGVRCWRWKEDAPWGKTIMRSIDEAVRVYDKLIVICSENSLKSPAVMREIERALQKEDDLCRQGKEAEVLFPIRLDDYIFEKWQHERKADVIKKNIGDFRNWKEPESYKKALDRLIRDLRAEKSPENEA